MEHQSEPPDVGNNPLIISTAECSYEQESGAVSTDLTASRRKCADIPDSAADRGSDSKYVRKRKEMKTHFSC